jgi:molybdenum-dependent DNA-binding transcriptional regulator ModE
VVTSLTFGFTARLGRPCVEPKKEQREGGSSVLEKRGKRHVGVYDGRHGRQNSAAASFS